MPFIENLVVNQIEKMKKNPFVQFDGFEIVEDSEQFSPTFNIIESDSNFFNT